MPSDSQQKPQQGNVVSYDEALSRVGSFGRYQCVLFIIGCVVYGSGPSVSNLSYVFTAARPDYWCHVPELESLNLTIEEIKAFTLPRSDDGQQEYSQCEMYDRSYVNLSRADVLQALTNNDTDPAPVTECRSGWTFDDSVYESSIITEWGLVCSKRALAAASQSVYMAGLMVGVVIFGFVSDFLGRKKALSIVCVINLAAFVSTGFAPNYYVFLGLRFMSAFSSISVFTCYFVLFVELVGSDWRTWIGMVIQYFWVTGCFFIVGSSYLVRRWRHLVFTLSIPFILYIPILFLIPESPRWLYQQGRHEEADAVMKRIAKWNKKPLKEKLVIDEKSVVKRVFLCKLCAFPKLRLYTVIMYFTWFVGSFCYYGLSLMATSYGGDDHFNFFLSAAVEIPACIFCHFTLNRCGRRPITGGTMFLGGVALLLCMAVPEGERYHWVLLILVTIGKFGIAAAFAILYIYSAEIFPTVIRNSALGSASFFARIGGIIAPQMALLGEFSRYIPLTAFGVLSLLSGLLCFLLPETVGTQMPETLEDGENMGRKSPKVKVPESEANKEEMIRLSKAPLTLNGHAQV